MYGLTDDELAQAIIAKVKQSERPKHIHRWNPVFPGDDMFSKCGCGTFRKIKDGRYTYFNAGD
jgi:hypothetical protein